MNKPYILTRRNLNPSARAISEALGLRKSFEPLNYPPVIRWGNSEGDFDEDTTLNCPEFIATCSHKKIFADTLNFREINSVLKIHNSVPERFPVVVRRTLSGSKGAGIVVCENAEEFLPYAREYWTYWHDFESEFGVHLLGGEIVKLFKKVREEDLDAEKYPIRNMERGYHFKRMNLENTSSFTVLRAFMREVYEKFPLKAGRFDVGFDRNSRSYVIIEANSAPGIAENPDTLGLYVNYFRKELGFE